MHRSYGVRPTWGRPWGATSYDLIQTVAEAVAWRQAEMAKIKWLTQPPTPALAGQYAAAYAVRKGLIDKQYQIKLDDIRARAAAKKPSTGWTPSRTGGDFPWTTAAGQVMHPITPAATTVSAAQLAMTAETMGEDAAIVPPGGTVPTATGPRWGLIAGGVLLLAALAGGAYYLSRPKAAPASPKGTTA